MTGNRPDLSLFDDANARKIPWDERVQLIKHVFPSTTNLDWSKLFRQDPALMGVIINDIIKASQASPNRPGKRAAVAPDVAREQLKSLAGEDYSMEVFAVSLKALMAGRSIRNTALKTGLDRNTIHRLLQGKIFPDAFTMECIARSFQKDPSYFSEYREAWILNALAAQFLKAPEASIHFYRKIRGVGRWGTE